MCGILGQFNWGNPRTEGEALRPVLSRLAHRGPDAEGSWEAPHFFFGHRRLSIIDLSSGAQPMEDGAGLAITFNGEIYNYLELRAELEGMGFKFRTKSDTEVLLHGYRAWGTGLPSRLIGMFSFAIADTKERSLFLARDRMGEKPFFLTELGSSVYFGSDLKSLLGVPGQKKSLHFGALAQYLCLNYVPGNQCLVENVSKLPPGSWKLYEASGRSSAEEYWRPGTATGTMAQEEALGRFRSLFDEAVAFSLRADVPVGIFLSGGIDSSLVAESAARQGKLAKAFCLAFDDPRFSELGKATAVAKRLGIPLEAVPLGPSIMEEFLDIASFSSDPLADSSMLPVWALSRVAGKQMKVVVGGDGGDELFGGYLTYKASRLHERLAASPLLLRRLLAKSSRLIPTTEGKVTFSYKLSRFLRAAQMPTREAHFSWNGSWLPAEAMELSATPELRAAAGNALSRVADSLGIPQRPRLVDLQAADLRSYLPDDILTKTDRMSMAHGLEMRSPFLNHHLAEFALALPDGLKITSGGSSKHLLRLAAARTFGPEISRAAKQGFSIPIHEWLRTSGRAVMEAVLSAPNVESTGVLLPGKVRFLMEEHLSGRRSLGFELWGLMVFVRWHGALMR